MEIYLVCLSTCENSNSLYYITRFATVERGGLLMYNGRLNEKHDFLAVEIVDGQVQLKYSTGGCGQWVHAVLTAVLKKLPLYYRKNGTCYKKTFYVENLIEAVLFQN